MLTRSAPMKRTPFKAKAPPKREAKQVQYVARPREVATTTVQLPMAQPVLKTFGVGRTVLDAVVSATEARIDHGNEIAAYLPLEDRIIMPDVGRFDSFPDYAATTLHELSHWTQPKHRLGIEGSYAENELFAEISSSYLMAALGIPHADDLRNTKAYIQSWLKSVGDDPKAIIKASSLASKAAVYLLAFCRPAEEADVESEAEAVAI